MEEVFNRIIEYYSMIEVSIIILTRNRKLLLQDCLNSLINNLKNLSYEIIVVDNASTDGSAQVAKSFAKVTLIQNKKNLGVAKGRNLGVSKARGEFIVFLDDDTFIKKPVFPKIINFMEKNKDVGIVGPKLLYPSGKIQESVRSFPTLLSILWRGTFLHKIFPSTSFYKNYILKDFNHREIKEVDWVLGACQVIRKEVFEELGLLDEKFFFGYEDIDFCYRAKKAGWKTIYWPYSQVYHYYSRRSAGSLLNKLKLEHIKSILWYFYKNNIIKDL